MSHQSTEATLDEYELVGKPTSIDELETDAPTAVQDAFHSLDAFHDSVVINESGERLLVGERANTGSKSFRLYGVPTDPDAPAFAGVLALRRRYDEPTIVAFDPAGEDADDETEIHPVDSLRVVSDPQSETLTTIINHLRTALTGEDWVETGRADTGFGEWNDAVLELLDFYKEYYDDPAYTLTHKFLKGATMHAIGRYPGDADKLLSSAAMRLDRIDDEDHGRYVNSPFALRRLLLDYAAVNLDLSDVEVSLTPAQ